MVDRAAEAAARYARASRTPPPPQGWVVSTYRSALVLLGGAGFMTFTTSMETLAERGRLSWNGVLTGLGLIAASVALGVTSLARADPSPTRERDVLRAAGCGGVGLGVALFFVGSAWAFVQLHRQSKPWPLDALLKAEQAPVLMSLVATAMALVGFLAAAAAVERRVRDPARVTPAARDRALALRAEGKTVREIAVALDSGGHRAPGGLWTGRLLRGVIRSAPRRPPEQKRENRQ